MCLTKKRQPGVRKTSRERNVDSSLSYEVLTVSKFRALFHSSALPSVPWAAGAVAKVRDLSNTHNEWRASASESTGGERGLANTYSCLCSLSFFSPLAYVLFFNCSFFRAFVTLKWLEGCSNCKRHTTANQTDTVCNWATVRIGLPQKHTHTLSYRCEWGETKSKSLGCWGLLYQCAPVNGLGCHICAQPLVWALHKRTFCIKENDLSTHSFQEARQAICSSLNRNINSIVFYTTFEEPQEF